MQEDQVTYFPAGLPRAMGSVLEVYPQGDYSQYMPTGTPAQRLASHWQAAGVALTRAMRPAGRGQHGRE